MVHNPLIPRDRQDDSRDNTNSNKILNDTKFFKDCPETT